MRAKKSLGQNFLTSHAIARDIVTAAQITADDTVLEVGPGKGFLTEHLLQKAGQVVAVEKDDRMIEYLKDKFQNEIASKKLELVHEDILSFDISRSVLHDLRYTLVANIPYYITGEILRLFLSSDMQPSRMVLMVQKEVAERIIARDGKESILSMSVKAYGEPHYIKKVPARYFSPKPNVDSAVLLIENISKRNFASNEDEEKFFEVVKRGFAHKRKVLLGNLKNFYAPQKLEGNFKKCGITPAARAENLSLEQWLCLNTNQEKTRE
jgi:16S rRNA (adenine1518-N6/adenine1519-N6)-dimethyltransferase